MINTTGVGPTGFKQRNRIRRRYILRDLFQKVDLCECGSWQGKSEVHRAGSQEGQAGIQGQQLELQSTSTVSSSSGKPQLCS